MQLNYVNHALVNIIYIYIYIYVCSRTCMFDEIIILVKILVVQIKNKKN